jgi:hypothetical protein
VRVVVEDRTVVQPLSGVTNLDASVLVLDTTTFDVRSKDQFYP